MGRALPMPANPAEHVVPPGHEAATDVQPRTRLAPEAPLFALAAEPPDERHDLAVHHGHGRLAGEVVALARPPADHAVRERAPPEVRPPCPHEAVEMPPLVPVHVDVLDIAHEREGHEGPQ